MSERRKLKRGVVLIVVLGVLMILVLLATTFAEIQRLEKTVSHNYVDDVRAKLLAQSGVEYAVSQIREMMSQGFFSGGAGSKAWIYWGNDVSETGNNPALLQVPIEAAQNPSWAYEDETPQNPTDPNVTPKAITIRKPDGSTIPVGFSATTESGTYAGYGDVYTLRVMDASGMIYVNDGLYQYNGNNSTVSLNLRRILNNLGSHSSVQIPGLGDAILNNRGNGYTNKYELRKAVNYNETLFNKFKDLVTTQAWVDKNVVNPVPLSAATVGQYPIPYWRGNQNPIYRRGRGMNQWWQDRFAAEPLRWYEPGNPNPNHNGIYAHDELFPQYIEMVWRAPVNVNTAPEPVLTSLLTGVQGFFSIERRRFQPFAGSPASFPYSGFGFGGTNITLTVPQQYYTWMYLQHTFDSQGTVGDEIGNLYDTASFVGPGSGTGTGGVAAQTIAEHIIACRTKNSYGGIDYASVPFGGPFKSWAQFHEFVDNLVEAGVIWDSRQIYGDYTTNPMPTGQMQWSPAAATSPNNKFASYAMGDALKANFNPNCNLNETNPDRNFFLRVDKTDLIVNSTEFCFTPMGYYEIESLGRVLRPENGGADALAPGAMCEVVAEKKILVSVKVYDVYRETSQRHFYASLLDTDATTGLAVRQTNPETNNNKSLEIGPEVDNGPLVYEDTWGLPQPFTTTPVMDGYAGYAPGVTTQSTGWGYEYSGYVALPTIGGNLTNPASSKPPKTLWTTSQGGSQFGEGIHTHFAWDFKAHWHQSAVAHGNDWFRDELGSVLRFATTYKDLGLYTKPPKIERALNFNDRGEPTLSPYCTAYNPKYRLARSFRLPPVTPSGTGTGQINIPLQEYAPSDLRIDGAYSERHSGIAYWMDQGVSWNEQGGILSAWIKPSYFPEQTGKMRKVFGMSRWHAKNYGYRNPNVWEMFYMPAHDTLPYVGSQTEGQPPLYIGSPSSTCSDHPPESMGGIGVYPFRPMSFNTMWDINCFTGSLADMFDEGPWLEEENYSCTPSLNHRWHAGEQGSQSYPGVKNYLDKGKWTHVIVWWNEKVGSWVPTPDHTIQTYIDGLVLPSTVEAAAGIIADSDFRKRYFTIQSFSDSATGKWLTNTIRLGECSSHGFGTFNRNYSADLTFDEVYIWANNKNSSLSKAISIWTRGRYYKPTWGNTLDSVFTSRSINLNQVAPMRYLPPPANVSPPYSTGGGPGPGTITSPVPKRRLLGVAWTWFAEAYAKTGTDLVPIMYDHQNPATPIPLYQTNTGQLVGTPEPCVRMFILVPGQSPFPLNDPEGFLDDGFSKVVDQFGKPVEITASEAENVKYRLWFQIRGLNAGSVPLATPIFEDVTLYFDSGDVEFLLYALVNTT